MLSRERRVFISASVLLETEWVLRAAYGLDDQVINEALRKLLALPQIEVAETRAIERSLALHAQGMNFADALHLALSAQADRFATFDRKLRAGAKRVKAPGMPKVIEP